MNLDVITINNFNQINRTFLSYPLSLIFMNIRSLRSHFSVFLASIHHIINEIKVIILAETNISDDENGLYRINDFNAIFLNRKDNEGNNKGVGVSRCISEKLSPSLKYLHKQNLVNLSKLMLT